MYSYISDDWLISRVNHFINWIFWFIISICSSIIIILPQFVYHYNDLFWNTYFIIITVSLTYNFWFFFILDTKNCFDTLHRVVMFFLIVIIIYRVLFTWIIKIARIYVISLLLLQLKRCKKFNCNIIAVFLFVDFLVTVRCEKLSSNQLLFYKFNKPYVYYYFMQASFYDNWEINTEERTFKVKLKELLIFDHYMHTNFHMRGKQITLDSTQNVSEIKIAF